MPKGNPSSKTRANDSYQKRIGLAAKSFKIYKTLADEFARTCKERNVGQAATISRLMREFIDNNI